VESVTGGVQVEDMVHSVLLVPQYHVRPWNLFGADGETMVVFFPADALPQAVDAPPIELVRLSKALSDESRLAILRLLSRDPQDFMSLVRATGLSKGTVHHHMVTLRAAGLVLVTAPVRDTTYSLRPGVGERMSLLLHRYLEQRDESGS
jgi:DNA-binding transcriptional ArsR family regulator